MRFREPLEELAGAVTPVARVRRALRASRENESRPGVLGKCMDVACQKVLDRWERVEAIELLISSERFKKGS